MDIRQLRYFLAVAREGQFTRAARQINIAQPPLSQQIRQLEEELDVQLFKRGSRRVELTEAGRVLLLRAEQILELVGSAKKELEDLNRGKQGTVTVGTVSSCGAFLLPQFMSAFHGQYPEVTFEVWEGDTYRIAELVDKGIVDIGIVRTPFGLSSYDYVYGPQGGGDDPMTAVCCGQWLREAPEGPVALAALEGLPLMVHRRYEQIIAEACAGNGFSPCIRCKGDDIRSIISWAELGLGVAVVPSPPEELFRPGCLRRHDITDSSLFTRTAVVWLKNTYLPAVVRNFIESIGRP